MNGGKGTEDDGGVVDACGNNAVMGGGRGAADGDSVASEPKDVVWDQTNDGK